jgi:hypothetical protein
MRKTPLGLALACLLSGGAVTLSPGALAEVTVIPVTGAELSEQLTGIVTIVNLERRMLTIRTPEGRFEVIHVPPEAKRLNEVRIGDRLTITESQAVLVDLVKGSRKVAVGATSESFVEREQSRRPAGAIVDTLTLRGRVEAIDKAKRTIRVKGAQETVEISVNDLALLDEIAVGDGVMATFVHSVRARVESR